MVSLSLNWERSIAQDTTSAQQNVISPIIAIFPAPGDSPPVSGDSCIAYDDSTRTSGDPRSFSADLRGVSPARYSCSTHLRTRSSHRRPVSDDQCVCSSHRRRVSPAKRRAFPWSAWRPARAPPGDAFLSPMPLPFQGFAESSDLDRNSSQALPRLSTENIQHKHFPECFTH